MKRMRIVTDCSTCDNDISIDFVEGERTAALLKRLDRHVHERGWQTLTVGKQQIGYCCVACCKQFGIEQETNGDTAKIISIR